ncbi:carboxymuconolactone decarboxylase family protein [Serratia odorifera]|uniref:Alkylhydroperoxidase AhpD family core domain protein n=2 Tax=Serratia odorifera TaxID=618 RepID=D4E6A9_SEROD|nr:carboxymuconolactone decarboxylase family protein [Serratia odorifera]EFE94838.1 alkylhydroperoxidase AhpD family core domain protein [Serratia odorifera DSM 4582]MBJ2064866.1 carboxymuconolactone decarboxylase family protein [Serratia odorifera]VDZ63263.1 Argininosuccinate synthase [Serratia odorifera]HEJ9093698.1 carboxymuconolactone decarboxylase family protein [Serratia odorifera]
MMSNDKAVRYEQEIPAVLAAMMAVHDTLTNPGLEPRLHHLVQLRASQINRCAFCVKMHTKEARDDGESNDRLDRLVVWDQVSDFSAREKAALAWTEALTTLSAPTRLGQLRAQLREHFSEQEIALLTASIAMINLWNRLQISRH